MKSSRASTSGPTCRSGGQLTAGAGVYSTTIWAARFARAQITTSVAVTSPLAMPWVMRNGSAAGVCAEARLAIAEPKAITSMKAVPSEIIPRHLARCISMPPTSIPPPEGLAKKLL